MRTSLGKVSGDAYDDVLSLVSSGTAAESSVEFRALDEKVTGARRTVLQATLPAIGVVDQGAYAGKLEVRRRGCGLAGRLDYNRPRVTADRGTVRKEMFLPSAFEYTLQDEGREILLQLGDDAGQVLASRRAGTLEIENTPEALLFEVETLPDTTYARDFRALLEAGTIAPGVLAMYRIPPADVVPDAERTEPDSENPDVKVRVIEAALPDGAVDPLPGAARQPRHRRTAPPSGPRAAARRALGAGLARMAVTLSFAKFREALGEDPSYELSEVGAEVIRCWFDAAREMVTSYAPKAPDAIANRAMLMIGGYWASEPSYTGAQRIGEPGWWDKWHDTSMAGQALRYSGAMPLLTRWKRRRAR